MNLDEFYKQAHNRELELPPLPKTGNVKKGTRVTLRNFVKYKSRRSALSSYGAGLRRFSIIGRHNRFDVKVNGVSISPVERNLKRLLDEDESGAKYLWEFDEEIKPGTGWRVRGWIGALNRTKPLDDGIQRGIVIMARGKLVQEPFMFDAVVGQQFALSYLIGEIHADFVDDVDDTISTAQFSRLGHRGESNSERMGKGKSKSHCACVG